MLTQKHLHSLSAAASIYRPVTLLAGLILFIAGCNSLCHTNEQQTAITELSESPVSSAINSNDTATTFKVAPINNVYTVPNTHLIVKESVPDTAAPEPILKNPTADINLNNRTPLFNSDSAACAEPFANTYAKTLAITSFPRIQVGSSKFGQLAQVEQQLPLLIGANLHNHHSLLVPAYIPTAFTNANNRGESATAAQAINVANQNGVQFLVTGEVDDMSLYSPSDVQNPSYFRKLMNGTIDMFNIDTALDNRGRVFSFSLQVRDGITGQVVFNNQYRTVGHWDAPANTEIGFASPRFWQTDYGKKIQQLVAAASDELAESIRCQAYISRVDTRPFQQQVVIQSGKNNGLRAGDYFDLYQLVYQPITGEYQQFDTQLIKRNGRVYLTEIYPAHSIGQVVDDTLSSGQFIVKAQ